MPTAQISLAETAATPERTAPDTEGLETIIQLPACANVRGANWSSTISATTRAETLLQKNRSIKTKPPFQNQETFTLTGPTCTGLFEACGHAHT